jgi:hypothetical protein
MFISVFKNVKMIKWFEEEEEEEEEEENLEKQRN